MSCHKLSCIQDFFNHGIFDIKKALAKNVEERYQTGTELATDLKAIFTELD